MASRTSSCSSGFRYLRCVIHADVGLIANPPGCSLGSCRGAMAPVPGLWLQELSGTPTHLQFRMPVENDDVGLHRLGAARLTIGCGLRCLGDFPSVTDRVNQRKQRVLQRDIDAVQSRLKGRRYEHRGRHGHGRPSGRHGLGNPFDTFGDGDLSVMRFDAEGGSTCLGASDTSRCSTEGAGSGCTAPWAFWAKVLTGAASMAARSLSMRLWISSSGLFIATSAKRSAFISSPVGRSNTFDSWRLPDELVGGTRGPYAVVDRESLPPTGLGLAHGQPRFLPVGAAAVVHNLERQGVTLMRSPCRLPSSVRIEDGR